jgi:hypothetical protein
VITTARGTSNDKMRGLVVIMIKSRGMRGKGRKGVGDTTDDFFDTSLTNISTFKKKKVNKKKRKKERKKERKKQSQKERK